MRSGTEIILCQTKYIKELLERSKMINANPLSTPMINDQHLSKNRGEAIFNDKRYRCLVGALQYVTLTKPDVSFSVHKVCQFI